LAAQWALCQADKCGCCAADAHIPGQPRKQTAMDGSLFQEPWRSI
jgi:hypothetical protein